MVKAKSVLISISTYLVVGSLLVVGLYVVSNPGYLQPCPIRVVSYKCSTTTDFIASLIARPSFWIEVLLWPLTLTTYFGS